MPSAEQDLAHCLAMLRRLLALAPSAD